MKKIIFLLPLLLALACSESSEERNNIDPVKLHGQWRNVFMRLDMKTYKNSDSSKVLEVNEENWERVMQIKPIRTYFWHDGTYNSMHYDLRDSLIYNPSGRWSLDKDSLMMTDTFPRRGVRYKYKVKLSGNMAEFSGTEDLDGDGKADDLYYGTQRRQK